MIQIPERMRYLDKDHRGYPIPFVVLRDIDGKAHFTINDTSKVMECRKKDLCSICGNKLFRGRWYFGGIKSAFHKNGAYIDYPTHHECMQFAAQVCPYLSKENYLGRIDDKTLDYNKVPNVSTTVDLTMDPNRPKVFVAGMAVRHIFTPNGYIVPKRPFIRVEFWKNGNQINLTNQEIQDLVNG